MRHRHIACGVVTALLGLTLNGAVVHAERPFADYPTAARAEYDRGRSLQRKHQYKEAISAYDQASQLGMKDYPRLLIGQADCLLGVRDYARAVARYTSFIEEVGLENSCLI